MIKYVGPLLVFFIMFLTLTNSAHAMDIVDLEVEEGLYRPDETVRGSGTVHDNNSNPVHGADVYVNLGEETKHITQTEKQGEFDFEFRAPWQEGEHVVDVYISKEARGTASKKISFDIIREAALDIIIPRDLISVEINSSIEVPIYIENHGTADINDLNIDIEGIPFDHSVNFRKTTLKTNDIRDITLQVDVPEDADRGIHQSQIGFEYNGNKVYETFSLNVTDVGELVLPEAEGASITGRMINEISALFFSLSSLKIMNIALWKILSITLGGISLFVLYNKSSFKFKRPRYHSSLLDNIKNSIKSDDGYGGRSYTGYGENIEREAVSRKISFLKDRLKE